MLETNFAAKPGIRMASVIHNLTIIHKLTLVHNVSQCQEMFLNICTCNTLALALALATRLISGCDVNSDCQYDHDDM